MPPIRPRTSPDQGSKVGGQARKAPFNPYRDWKNPRSRTADTHNEIRNPYENFSPWANKVGGTPTRGRPVMPAPKPGELDKKAPSSPGRFVFKGDRNNTYSPTPDSNRSGGWTTTGGSINKYDSGNRNQSVSNRNPRATALNNVRKKYV
jgi:hypothetical protein